MPARPKRSNTPPRFPKPRGAIARYWDLQLGEVHDAPRPPIEVKLLTYIAEHADLLEVPRPKRAPLGTPDGWLLVPSPQWLIDELAALYADREDREPDDEFDNSDLDGDRAEE